ncbi:altronate oxidoreductase [Anaerobacillus alkalilacustris]|uniref:Altronate oxidoreductase n=1 Tax=Anaerobacillus alkalilacustris TaxID=393763 RepID=A0A1S2LR59_9BACI|nr:tagaturonate reductase [Anaerobacillus alkalilacustris]OIJ14690.1 altronate oxidoreductase [Anaerobacillus alkalilacustris]
MQQILNRDLDKAKLSSSVIYEGQTNLPEKVIQFGEGNFLRGFIDWMINELNKQGLFNGRVVVVQPRSQDKIPIINEQDGLYTVVLKGIVKGERVEKSEIVSSISRGINIVENWDEILKVATSRDIRYVFSNTTEAGLTYLQEEYDPDSTPKSFPGKLTSLLYHRFIFMKGCPESGLVIIPCELVEENGNVLKQLVIKLANEWKLPKDFMSWVEFHNHFCNTLVDRIVTGYPKDDIEGIESMLGYKDRLLTVGEPYHLFAIDADESIAQEIPFEKAGLNVKWGDITPYREIKVRLLNGPHTMIAAVCYLSGVNTVQEAMEDKILGEFIKYGMYREIYPTINISEVEKKDFTDSVIERFLNPYNKHYLTDIALSSVSKFKSRLLPCLEEYVAQNNTLPGVITFSLAALLAYNRPIRIEGNSLVGMRGQEEYYIRDNQEVLNLVNKVWSKYDGSRSGIDQLVSEIIADSAIWGRNLTEIKQLPEAVAYYLNDIVENGMKMSVEKLILKVGAK